MHADHAAAPDSQTPNGLRSIHVADLARRNGWRREQVGTSVLGIPIEAWWPTTNRPTRVVWAAIHGEESVTLQAAHHLLRVVHADDACAVVVPVLNPDGVLAGTRQNARGVDLNRNFAGDTWSAAPSPTFWSTTTVRTSERRTQLSSPGERPGSEPETQAVMALIERVAPEYVVDLHTPLECVIARSEQSLLLAEHLAAPAQLPIVRALDAPTTGDSTSWCETVGATAVTYEFELAPMPAIWARHAEALVRCVVDRLVPGATAGA